MQRDINLSFTSLMLPPSYPNIPSSQGKAIFSVHSLRAPAVAGVVSCQIPQYLDWLRIRSLGGEGATTTLWGKHSCLKSPFSSSQCVCMLCFVLVHQCMLYTQIHTYTHTNFSLHFPHTLLSTHTLLDAPPSLLMSKFTLCYIVV